MKTARYSRWLLVLSMLIGLSGCAGFSDREFTEQERGMFEQYAPTYVDDPSTSLTVRYWGTSTLLFDDGEEAVLIDGYFSRPSLKTLIFGELKQKTQTEIREILDPVLRGKLKAVAVAHAHHDHAMDSSCVSLAYDATLIASSSVKKIRCGDTAATNYVETNDDVTIPNQTQSLVVDTIGSNFRLTVIPSKHIDPGFGARTLLGMGQPITEVVSSPAHALCYNEGQSYVFLVEHLKSDTNILIYPSANIKEASLAKALDGKEVDWMFMGIANLSKAKPANLMQTIYQITTPKFVVPIHYDDFTRPSNGGFAPSKLRFGEFYPDFMALKNASDEASVEVRLVTYDRAVALQLR